MWFSRGRTAVATDPGTPPGEPDQAFVEATDQVAPAPSFEPAPTTPSGGEVSAPSVAASVGTVGYAMFALLRRGPLDSVPTFEEFLDRPEGDDSAATDEQHADLEVFGSADIDEHLSAVTRSAVADAAVPGRPVTNGHAAAGGHAVGTPAAVAYPSVSPAEPAGTPTAVTASPAVEPPGASAPADLEVAPLFAHPAPPARTSNTLAMLQEISFLDE